MPTSPAMILLLRFETNAGSLSTAPDAVMARPNVLIGRTSCRGRGLPPKRQAAGPKWSGSEARSGRAWRPETGWASSAPRQGGPSVGRPSQVVAVFGILDVVTNREVAVVPARTGRAKSLRSTAAADYADREQRLRNPKASSTAFAGMSAKDVPTGEKAGPSSRPVALPFSLRWC